MTPYFKAHLIEKRKQMNRTTKMVLGITIFSLTNNTLLAIAKSLIVILGDEFEKDCSPAIACVNNLFALIYTIIPFVVYYLTSRQFRDNFKSLFSKSGPFIPQQNPSTSKINKIPPTSSY